MTDANWKEGRRQGARSKVFRRRCRRERRVKDEVILLLYSSVYIVNDLFVTKVTSLIFIVFYVPITHHFNTLLSISASDAKSYL